MSASKQKVIECKLRRLGPLPHRSIFLSYEKVNILLDPGPMPLQSLQWLAEQQVDLILVSNADWSCIGSLPYLFANANTPRGSKCARSAAHWLRSPLPPIFTSRATYCQMVWVLFWQRLEQSLRVADSVLFWSVVEIRNILKHVCNGGLVPWQQSIFTKDGEDVLILSLFPTGYGLGHCGFAVTPPQGEAMPCFIYANEVTNWEEGLIPALNIRDFSSQWGESGKILDPLMLIPLPMPPENFSLPSKREKDLIFTLQQHIPSLETVVFPCEVVTRGLPLLLTLTKGAVTAPEVGVFLLAPYAQQLLDRWKTLTEWSVTKEKEKASWGLIDRVHACPDLPSFHKIRAASKFQKALIVVDSVGLDNGSWARSVVLDNVSNPKSMILWTSIPYKNVLAHSILHLPTPVNSLPPSSFTLQHRILSFLDKTVAEGKNVSLSMLLYRYKILHQFGSGLEMTTDGNDENLTTLPNSKSFTMMITDQKDSKAPALLSMMQTNERFPKQQDIRLPMESHAAFAAFADNSDEYDDEDFVRDMEYGMPLDRDFLEMAANASKMSMKGYDPHKKKKKETPNEKKTTSIPSLGHAHSHGPASAPASAPALAITAKEGFTNSADVDVHEDRPYSINEAVLSMDVPPTHFHEVSVHLEKRQYSMAARKGFVDFSARYDAKGFCLWAEAIGAKRVHFLSDTIMPITMPGLDVTIWQTSSSRLSQPMIFKKDRTTTVEFTMSKSLSCKFDKHAVQVTVPFDCAPKWKHASLMYTYIQPSVHKNLVALNHISREPTRQEQTLYVDTTNDKPLLTFLISKLQNAKLDCNEQRRTILNIKNAVFVDVQKSNTISLTGNLSEEYFKTRDLLYQRYKSLAELSTPTNAAQFAKSPL